MFSNQTNILGVIDNQYQVKQQLKNLAIKRISYPRVKAVHPQQSIRGLKSCRVNV